VDDFGQHGSWIEIFNTAYNSVNIGSLYLSDDRDNLKKYQIVKGQPITLIPPRGYLVFWADDMPSRGILHLNFNISEGKSIYLVDSNGRTVLDSVKIVSPQKSDVTYGRLVDGGNEWGYLPKSTPKSDNDTSEKVATADKFVVFDPTGVGMAVIAMSVVFSALAFLFLFFKTVGFSMTHKERKAAKEKALAKEKSAIVSKKEEGMSGEIGAAIAMALHMYRNQLHDQEDPVITIAKVSKTYSPWSSKIYGLRKSPR
jgi:Na+-transporting methylmalonyl-CoA/oxaloacetate decarboxylase gamma subunit